MPTLSRGIKLVGAVVSKPKVSGVAAHAIVTRMADVSTIRYRSIKLLPSVTMRPNSNPLASSFEIVDAIALGWLAHPIPAILFTLNIHTRPKSEVHTLIIHPLVLD